MRRIWHRAFYKVMMGVLLLPLLSCMASAGVVERTGELVCAVGLEYDRELESAVDLVSVVGSAYDRDLVSTVGLTYDGVLASAGELEPSGNEANATEEAIEVVGAL